MEPGALWEKGQHGCPFLHFLEIPVGSVLYLYGLEGIIKLILIVMCGFCS